MADNPVLPEASHIPQGQPSQAQPKRGRGRPRKHPVQPSPENEESDDLASPQCTQSPAVEVQPKRGRGRPRKNPIQTAPNEVACAIVPILQAAQSLVVEAQPKRGRGRPRKNPIQASPQVVAEVQPRKTSVMEASSSQACLDDDVDSDEEDTTDRDDSEDVIDSSGDIQEVHLTYFGDVYPKALTQEARTSGVKNGVIRSIALLSVNMGESQLEELLMCILCHTKIEGLTITDMEGGDRMTELIVQYGMRREDKSLRVLRLSNVKMGWDGATVLKEALAMPDCILVELDLTDNELGEEGVSRLASGLRHNTSLQTLKLGGHRIGRDAAKAIGSMLSTNKGLVSLTVSVDQGALGYLMRGLKHNKTLTHLCLVETDLRYEDVECFAVANTVLSNLELERTHIEPKALQALRQMMKHRDSSIKVLTFRGCPLTGVIKK